MKRRLTIICDENLAESIRKECFDRRKTITALFIEMLSERYSSDLSQSKQTRRKKKVSSA